MFYSINYNHYGAPKQWCVAIMSDLWTARPWCTLAARCRVSTSRRGATPRRRNRLEGVISMCWVDRSVVPRAWIRHMCKGAVSPHPACKHHHRRPPATPHTLTVIGPARAGTASLPRRRPTLRRRSSAASRRSSRTSPTSSSTSSRCSPPASSARTTSPCTRAYSARASSSSRSPTRTTAASTTASTPPRPSTLCPSDWLRFGAARCCATAPSGSPRCCATRSCCWTSSRAAATSPRSGRRASSSASSRRRRSCATRSGRRCAAARASRCACHRRALRQDVQPPSARGAPALARAWRPFTRRRVDALSPSAPAAGVPARRAGLRRRHARRRPARTGRRTMSLHRRPRCRACATLSSRGRRRVGFRDDARQGPPGVRRVQDVPLLPRRRVPVDGTRAASAARTTRTRSPARPRQVGRALPALIHDLNAVLASAIRRAARRRRRLRGRAARRSGGRRCSSARTTRRRWPSRTSSSPDGRARAAPRRLAAGTTAAAAAVGAPWA